MKRRWIVVLIVTNLLLALLSALCLIGTCLNNKFINEASQIEYWTVNSEDKGWFSLMLPLLLPKKEEGSADYIRAILYPAMRDFFIAREPKIYKNCVLIYRHVYDMRRPERRKRDHDNIEINMVSDIVAMYVMPDDGPDCCSHFYCSAEGNAERTEVYVVPEQEFNTWLAAEPDMPDKGVALYETVPETVGKEV